MIAALATDLATTRTQQEVQMTMLKKAIELQEQGALQLLSAVTQQSYNNPPHLGQQIDVKA